MAEKKTGILEVSSKGFGFLRNPEGNFAPQTDDLFVSPKMIRDFKLTEGIEITGEVGRHKTKGQSLPLVTIDEINRLKPKEYLGTVTKGITIDPVDQLRVCQGPTDVLGRAIDLITPIGMGTRGMIISPPKAGKTTILKHIAKSVLMNNPEVQVIILLIDERPEEVTDFRREVEGASVYYSSIDQSVESHVRTARLTMNMAFRKMELGQDVFVLIDSLTRLGRAFNKDTDSYGKTLSGGLGANALELPRKFFGSARKIENGGSLTIVASILTDTGSRMDEVIFQEFKGTGNMDLVLSRECAEKRMFPAININDSGTRKEEKIMTAEDLKTATKLRRAVAGYNPPDALEVMLAQLSP